MKPQVGDIAVCSKGIVGRINREPRKIQYPDGRFAIAWTGIKLWPDTGDPWSSSEPQVIARQSGSGYQAVCCEEGACKSGKVGDWDGTSLPPEEADEYACSDTTIPPADLLGDKGSVIPSEFDNWDGTSIPPEYKPDFSPPQPPAPLLLTHDKSLDKPTSPGDELGVQFKSLDGEDRLLVTEGPFKDWLCFRGSEGQIGRAHV